MTSTPWGLRPHTPSSAGSLALALPTGHGCAHDLDAVGAAPPHPIVGRLAGARAADRHGLRHDRDAVGLRPHTPSSAGSLALALPTGHGLGP
jgi:hypothetical protein